MEKEYLQPDFYHFNRDSIELANYINKKTNGFSFLDKNSEVVEVGAGSGVITCELFKNFKGQIKGLTLIEAQEGFSTSLKGNIEKHIPPTLSFQIELETIEGWAAKSKVRPTLIYFNPPYFFREDSRPSESWEKDNCRRIKKEKLKKWLEICVDILAPKGELYFCHRFENITDILNLPFHLECHQNHGESGCFFYRYSERL